MDRNYLTTEEVALRLGVTASRVRQLLLAGKIQAERIGDRYRGLWKISEQAVEDFKATRRGPGRPKIG